VLLVVALGLGIFLLRASDPSAEQARIETTDTTTTVPLDGFGDAPAVDAPSLPAGPRPPAEVKVLVVNASGVQGAAGAKQKALSAAGYTSVGTGTAPRLATATAVQHIEGYESEAQAVASALTLSPTVVGPVPNPPPVPTGDAAVLVVLGTDSKGPTTTSRPATAATTTSRPASATTTTAATRPTP
jgi:hypothetical protein